MPIGNYTSCTSCLSAILSIGHCYIVFQLQCLLLYGTPLYLVQSCCVLIRAAILHQNLKKCDWKWSLGSCRCQIWWFRYNLFVIVARRLLLFLKMLVTSRVVFTTQNYFSLCTLLRKQVACHWRPFWWPFLTAEYLPFGDLFYPNLKPVIGLLRTNP